jgi:hypothetical protein
MRDGINAYPERNTVRNHPLPRGNCTNVHMIFEYRKELFPWLFALSFFLRMFSLCSRRVNVSDRR